LKISSHDLHVCRLFLIISLTTRINAFSTFSPVFEDVLVISVHQSYFLKNSSASFLETSLLPFKSILVAIICLTILEYAFLSIISTQLSISFSVSLLVVSNRINAAEAP
jgi:hypothetical protein